MNEYKNLDDLDYALTYITKEGEKKNSFPIDTEVNTRMSNIFFDKLSSQMPKLAKCIAAKQLSKACIEHGVQPIGIVKSAAEECPGYVITNLYIENKEEPMSKRIKVASTEKSKYFYALVKEAGDGTVNAQYAMPTVEYIKTASDYFDKHHRSFSVGDRHKYASNVLKRSAELGTDVTSESILKYAGVNFNSSVGDAILLRKTLLDSGSKMAQAFDKLASYQGTTSPETFANVLYEMDKKAGLDKYYGRYLPDPYLSTFDSGIRKVANVLFTDEEGRTVTSENFASMASSKYELIKQYFGKTLADGLKKEGPIAFQALPKNAKETIARIASGEIK